jgi:hypothetical protein
VIVVDKWNEPAYISRIYSQSHVWKCICHTLGYERSPRQAYILARSRIPFEGLIWVIVSHVESDKNPNSVAQYVIGQMFPLNKGLVEIWKRDHILSLPSHLLYRNAIELENDWDATRRPVRDFAVLLRKKGHTN